MTTEIKQIGTFKNREGYEAQLDAGIRRIVARNAELGKAGQRQHLLAFVLTGGGTNLPNRFAEVEGASGTWYGTDAPYNEARTKAILGERAEQVTSMVSRDVAEWLATAILSRSIGEIYNERGRQAGSGKALGPSPRLWALSLTAAVKTSRERRGPDWAFLGLADQGKPVHTIAITFERKTWSREDQNLICELLGFNLIVEKLQEANFFEEGLPDQRIPISNEDLPGKLFSPEKRYHLHHKLLEREQFVTRATPVIRPAKTLEQLLSTDERYAVFSVRGVPGTDLAAQFPSSKFCALPTSANPLTESHRFICDVLEQLGYQPVLELTDQHPDKGTLTTADLMTRLSGCFGREHVRVSKHGYFADKAAMRGRNERTFAIGIDVAEKLLNPSFPRFERDMETLLALGARFLVFPRVLLNTSTGERVRKGLHEVVIPTKYAPLFQEVDVRVPDFSSTEFRAALGIS